MTTNANPTQPSHAEHIILDAPSRKDGAGRRASVLIRNGVVIAVSEHGDHGAPEAWCAVSGGVMFPVLIGHYRDRIMAAQALGYLYAPETAPAPEDIPGRS